MQCDKCRNAAVLFQPYSGRYLCGRHLAADVEARAKHSIRAHRWLTSGDHIVAAIGGDRQSAALLCFLKRLIADRRDVRLSAILTGAGTAGSDLPPGAGRLAASMGIAVLQCPCGDGPAAAEWERTCRDDDRSRLFRMPCRSLQQTLAEEYKVTRIATGFSLDDLALRVLGQFLLGNADSLMHPPGSGAISLICPFMSIPSHELDLYWDFWGTGEDLPCYTPLCDRFSRDVTALLGDYYHNHPATKYALLHLGEQLSGGTMAGILAAGTGREDSGT